jgi:hypothetical protein
MTGMLAHAIIARRAEGTQPLMKRENGLFVQQEDGHGWLREVSKTAYLSLAMVIRIAYY